MISGFVHFKNTSLQQTGWPAPPFWIWISPTLSSDMYRQFLLFRDNLSCFLTLLCYKPRVHSCSLLCWFWSYHILWAVHSGSWNDWKIIQGEVNVCFIVLKSPDNLRTAKPISNNSRLSRTWVVLLNAKGGANPSLLLCVVGAKIILHIFIYTLHWKECSWTCSFRNVYLSKPRSSWNRWKVTEICNRGFKPSPDQRDSALLKSSVAWS